MEQQIPEQGEIVLPQLQVKTEGLVFKDLKSFVAFLRKAGKLGLSLEQVADLIDV
jgi:hypothetical protein